MGETHNLKQTETERAMEIPFSCSCLSLFHSSLFFLNVDLSETGEANRQDSACITNKCFLPSVIVQSH